MWWCNTARLIHFSTGLFDTIYDIYNRVCAKLMADKSKGMSDDQQILTKIAQGDTFAFEQLIQKYYQWLIVIVQVKYPKMDFHQDVIHETFIVVFEKIQLQQIKNPDQVKSFMRTCAINIAHQYYRNAKRHQSSIKQEHIEMIEHTTMDLSKSYELGARKELAVRMINQMDIDRDRLILKYHYFDHLDKAVICEKLNLTHEHFDRVLYRARMRLKDMISHQIKMPSKDQDVIIKALSGLILVFITFFEQMI